MGGLGVLENPCWEVVSGSYIAHGCYFAKSFDYLSTTLFFPLAFSSRLFLVTDT